jgi:hypothetical protein
MLYLQIFVFAVLAFIAWQDFKFRAVYWWLFVWLLIALAAAKYLQADWHELQHDFTINAIFLLMQIIFLHVYFSLKERKIINLFKGYFGLGDLFFLVAIAAYFSFFNYLLFYLSSLLMVIMVNTALSYTAKRHDKKIPLAGEQAILLALLLITDQLSTEINLTSDTWLTQYLAF